MWEDELLEECRGLPHGVTLLVIAGDKWLWHLDSAIGYSVRGVYQFLCLSNQQFNDYASELLWQEEVSVKVYLLV